MSHSLSVLLVMAAALAAPLARAQTNTSCSSPIPDQVAEVRGRALASGATIYGGITVTVFNGFESRSSTTAADGSYCVPLARSANGTLISVFASRNLYAARSVNTLVRLDPQLGAKSVVSVPAITLTPMRNPQMGSLAGVLYIRSVSGRPRPIEGISGFDGNIDLLLSGAGTQLKLRTDSIGRFSAEVPPGVYTLQTARNIVIEKVEVRTGAPTVMPVFSGKQINF